MKKLIIFDLDGTLLNTIDDLGAACNEALRAFGFDTHSADEYPKLVGNGVNKLIERALPEGHKDIETVLRLKEIFIPYYNQHNRVHTHPYDGIEPLIGVLKEKGITLAVASNKYQEATEMLIQHYFGNDTFTLVCGERAGRDRKPNPQIVYDILAATSMKADDVLYIGDSDVDMQTASNAGLESVACTWGFCTRDKLLACNPSHIANHPLEILTWI